MQLILVVMDGGVLHADFDTAVLSGFYVVIAHM